MAERSTITPAILLGALTPPRPCLRTQRPLAGSAYPGFVMNAAAVAEVALFLFVLTVVSKPLGVYIYKVIEGAPTAAGACWRRLSTRYIAAAASIHVPRWVGSRTWPGC